MRETTKEILVRSIIVALFLLIGAAVFYSLEKNEEGSEETEQTHLAHLRANLSINISSDEFSWLVNRLREHMNHARATKPTFYSSFCFCASMITTIGEYRELILFASCTNFVVKFNCLITAGILVRRSRLE